MNSPRRGMSMTLSYPPSVNHYYRHTARGVFLGPAGRAYREAVAAEVDLGGLREYFAPDVVIEAHIELWAPDRRKRDVDNTLKALLDALQAAGVYTDDAQIGRLTIVRRRVLPPGSVTVSLREMGTY